MLMCRLCSHVSVCVFSMMRQFLSCSRGSVHLLLITLLFARRAPVLVAIALIQNGMDSVSAVTAIRDKRRGAINAVQLAYLEEYQSQAGKKGCVVM